MPHQIPAHINPKLTPFVYRSKRMTAQPTTKTVERTVPGAISGFADPNSGVVTINQQSSYTVSEQVYAGNVYFYFATFDGPNGSTIEFQVGDGFWLAVGKVLYIGIEKEFWVFQYEDMPTPHMIIETPPGGEKSVWLPGRDEGTDLQSPEAQMDMRAGTFPLRSYLDKIGKNTPRSLLSSSRLEAIMSKTKSNIAHSYKYADWPRRKDTLPKDASVFERIFWPILKYKPTKTLDFGITQKVSGEINKTWVGSSLIIGTLAAYMVDGIFLQQTLRALGLNPYFFMHTITGLFFLWLFFTGCSLTALLMFMKPAIKKPFKFDEESFFKILNTPYHNQANLGFCCLDYVDTHTKDKLDLISDEQVKSNRLWSAHQSCAFIYKSYSDLVNKLEETKLTAEERATLLDQIAAQPPSF